MNPASSGLSTMTVLRNWHGTRKGRLRQSSLHRFPVGQSLLESPDLHHKLLPVGQFNVDHLRQALSPESTRSTGAPSVRWHHPEIISSVSTQLCSPEASPGAESAVDRLRQPSRPARLRMPASAAILHTVPLRGPDRRRPWLRRAAEASSNTPRTAAQGRKETPL